jgi:hypothetical protein
MAITNHGAPITDCSSGLIQSVSQMRLPGLRAVGEVGRSASSQCSKAFLRQLISI